MTYGDICNSALTEIRVARAGDVVGAETMMLALQLATELYDDWNGTPDGRASYVEEFVNETFVPNLNPHTIGPTGTFVVTQRPVSIEFASVNLNGYTPNVYVPINLRSKRWYANQPVPDLTNAFPTDLYYAPDWPNGSLYFWGVPTVNYKVRLWMRVLMQPVAQATVFAMPPGYLSAFRLTLAEKLAPCLGQTVSASTAIRAREARARIFQSNEDTPALHTADSGLGNNAPAKNAFNWLSRTTD